jgi:MOSC domain-containing protein YiiM
VPGSVTHIFTADVAGAPMRAHRAIRALAGVGLEGDRYAAGSGAYSGHPGAGRHLTLVSQEWLDAASAELRQRLAPIDVRRNLVTVGVDLDALLGTRVRIGTVVCDVVRTCPPCTYLDGLLGRRVLDALRGRGGIRADLVTDGTIRVGDAIEPA